MNSKMGDDTLVLRFQDGPWDGANMNLNSAQADIGFKVEWAVRIKSEGATHLYESEIPLLEDSTELAMQYLGSNAGTEWKPGIFLSSEFESDETAR